MYVQYSRQRHTAVSLFSHGYAQFLITFDWVSTINLRYCVYICQSVTCAHFWFSRLNTALEQFALEVKRKNQKNVIKYGRVKQTRIILVRFGYQESGPVPFVCLLFRYFKNARFDRCMRREIVTCYRFYQSVDNKTARRFLLL